jgi:hypothetical protein
MSKKIIAFIISIIMVVSMASTVLASTTPMPASGDISGIQGATYAGTWVLGTHGFAADFLGSLTLGNIIAAARTTFDTDTGSELIYQYSFMPFPILTGTHSWLNQATGATLATGPGNEPLVANVGATIPSSTMKFTFWNANDVRNLGDIESVEINNKEPRVGDELTAEVLDKEGEDATADLMWRVYAEEDEYFTTPLRTAFGDVFAVGINDVDRVIRVTATGTGLFVGSVVHDVTEVVRRAQGGGFEPITFKLVEGVDYELHPEANDELLRHFIFIVSEIYLTPGEHYQPGSIRFHLVNKNNPLADVVELTPSFFRDGIIVDPIATPNARQYRIAIWDNTFTIFDIDIEVWATEPIPQVPPVAQPIQ